MAQEALPPGTVAVDRPGLDRHGIPPVEQAGLRQRGRDGAARRIGLRPAGERPSHRRPQHPVHLHLDRVAPGPGAPTAVDRRDGAASQRELGEHAVLHVHVVGGPALVHSARDVATAGGADRLHLAGQGVDHVTPVREHIQDQPAAVPPAVVPAWPLARLREAVIHPAAHLHPNLQHLAEEPGPSQPQQCREARQEQLVLHRAGLHPRRLRRRVQGQRLGRAAGDRLLGIDVLARRDGPAQHVPPQPGRGRVEHQRLRGRGKRRVQAGRRAREPGAGGDGGELRGVAADQHGIGRQPRAVGQRQAALVAHRHQRRQVLALGQLAGCTIEDDADAPGGHARRAAVRRFFGTHRPGLARRVVPP